MLDFFQPLLAAATAAMLGATGPAADAPDVPPDASCRQWVHNSATGTHQSPGPELVEKIRGLVADLTAAARAGGHVDLALITAAIDRAGLPSTGRADCTTSGSAERRVSGSADAASNAAEAATRVASRITDAVAAGGFVVAPAANSDDEEDGDTGDDKHGDTGDDSGNDSDPADQAEDGHDADKAAPIPRAQRAPLPSPPSSAWPPRPDAPSPPTPGGAASPSTPGGAAPDSPAASLEQQIRELATTLQASNDPALRPLLDQLREVLDRGLVAPGDPRGPLPIPDVLPSRVTDLLFSDDFEGGDLGKWGSCQGAGVNGDCAGLTVADGMGVGQDPQRGMVAQFRVADGQEAEMGGERSEVRDDDPEMVVREGDERWYSWSMKFPQDFPEPDGGYYIVMQWHQTSDSGSPPLALDISQGSLDIGGDGVGAPRQTIGPIRRGEWVDYVMHVGFSQSDGFVEAWENGVQTVQRTSRPTLTDPESYIKLGIYRDPDSTGDAEVLFDDFMIYNGGAGSSPGTSPAGPGDGQAAKARAGESDARTEAGERPSGELASPRRPAPPPSDDPAPRAATDPTARPARPAPPGPGQVGMAT